ncbi:unnamed protein product [Closterium sp. NIES-64]|nr:unnamed protein product [Closterium sp. NIES-64]
MLSEAAASSAAAVAAAAAAAAAATVAAAEWCCCHYRSWVAAVAVDKWVAAVAVDKWVAAVAFDKWVAAVAVDKWVAAVAVDKWVAAVAVEKWVAAVAVDKWVAAVAVDKWVAAVAVGKWVAAVAVDKWVAAVAVDKWVVAVAVDKSEGGSGGGFALPVAEGGEGHARDGCLRAAEGESGRGEGESGKGEGESGKGEGESGKGEGESGKREGESGKEEGERGVGRGKGEGRGKRGESEQGEGKGRNGGSSSSSSNTANGGESNLITPLLDADADDDYDDGDFLSLGSTDATSAGVEEGAGAAGKRAAIGGEDEKSADSIRKYEICKRLIQRPPLVCAHGGDSFSAPPNSLAALERAVAAGADAVEVDASLTADGHLVALHDRDVQSLLNDPSARVPSLVFSQIRQLDLSPLWPATSPRDAATQQVPVLTLQQALQALIGRVKHITVDVKIATSAIAENRHMAQRLLNVFERVGGCAECLVWSKEDQFIRHLSRIQPSIKADWVHSVEELQDWGGQRVAAS